MSVADVSYDFLASAQPSPKGGATARVHAALREAIVSLEFKPGEFLDKQAIAARMGVSRFPVGEALNRLATEGLVDIIPQSGSRVSLIKISDARQNMFLRRSLEVQAVRTIAPRCTGQLIEALRQNLLLQRAAIESGDRNGFHGFDLGFHAILLDTLGFERVRAAAETAHMGLERVRRMLSSRRRQEDSAAEHECIVESFEARDGEAAAAAMDRHLGSVMTDLEYFARARPELFADLNNGGMRT